MVKINYAAWQIDATDLSEDFSDLKKLQFFARYAVLAPSGHNTQPWHFGHRGQTLLLKANAGRHLPHSGTAAAEPHISLGCCLETLCLAAKGFGYELLVDYGFSKDVVAAINLGKKVVAEPSLLTAITSRTSNRNPYEPKPLASALLKAVTAGDFTGVSALAITRKEDISFLADQTKHATHIIMTEQEFRSELSKWVRSNVSKQYDGMPGFAQGMPTPPSLIAKHIIKHVDISKSQAKKDADRIVNSPALILINAEKPGDAEFLNAGRLYARICVRAQQAGIATSGVGAAVIDPTTRQVVQAHFGLSSRPIAIIRLGLASKHARHTPRWPLHKVID
ncbi:MAG: Acg family FMN-binding oxidoreductase [Candidatus Saccharimonadales bacterium]